MPLNDEQVRAELERIDPAYARSFPHSSLPQKQLYRLLAESQQALGKIVGLLQHQLDKEDPDDLITILQLLDVLMIIARKHWKGGK